MTGANHSAWAEIDLRALVRNYHILRPESPPRKVIAVVKADAYGHGAVEAARTLSAEGADMLAVATLVEGEELRAAGIDGPILLLGAFPQTQVKDILAADLTASISSAAFARALDEAARSVGKKAPVHIKVDTGMGRLGIPEAAAVEAIEKISMMPNLRLEGIYTHFAAADEEDKAFTLRQVGAFNRVVSVLGGLGIKFKYHHAAASAACLDVPESLYDTIRPGLALYGLRPAACCGRQAKLTPVMEFAARVTHIERRGAASTIGYGRTHTLARDATVAVVSAGYADGYDRRFSDRGVVTIRGKEAPVLGRVSMDMISVDVSRIPTAAPGDKAVLFSSDPKAPNSVECLAAMIDTIPYCLVCGVSSRVKRVYRR